MSIDKRLKELGLTLPPIFKFPSSNRTGCVASGGQFAVFDKTAYALVRSIVLPVPTERTKGVLVSRTAFGNLIVGVGSPGTELEFAL